jgi:hypothetical protein
MKITFNRGEVTASVEVDSDEAMRLLERLGFVARTGSSNADQLASSLNQSAEAGSQADFERFRRVYRLLSDKPRLVLSTLYDHPSGMTDVELRKALESHGMKTLAGSMTAIAKVSQSQKVDRELVLIRQKQRDRYTGSYFHYTLGPLAQTYFEKMKGAKP